MLSFEYLRKVAFSQVLLDRVRLGRPPDLLFSVWLDDLSALLGVSSESTIKTLCSQISDLINMEVYVNYYVDKRERAITFDLSKRSSFLFGNNGETPTHELGQSTIGKRSGVVGVVGVNRV